MANYQDVDAPVNPYDGAAGQWGGKQGDIVDPNKYYQGGFTTDKYGDQTANDPAAFAAAIRRAEAESNATSGRGQAVDRYQSMGAAALGRTAPNIDYGRADSYLSRGRNFLGAGQGYLNSGMGDRSNALESRGQQMGALALQQQAAMGQAPSQAQLLGRNMIDQSLQAQLAGAASARGGPMAQAAAMRQASMGAAATQQQGQNSLSALRAQEMANARDAWQAGATGMRGQDYMGAQNAAAMAGQASTMAGQATSMGATAAQMEQYRAAMNMQQRTLNQQDQQFYEGQAWNTNNAQLNASLGRANAQQQSDQFGQQMNMQQQQQNQQMWAAIIGGGAAMGSAAIGKRADGGPVEPGHPTLVGERGPELVMSARESAGRKYAEAAGGFGGGEFSPVDFTPIGMGANVINMGRGAAARYLGLGVDEEPEAVDPDAAERAAVLEDYARVHNISVSEAHARIMAAQDRMRLMSAKPAPVAPAPAPASPGVLGRIANFFGGARAGGGPVAPRGSYLVGENGPEIIVPQERGMVLPAHHPMSMAAASKMSSQPGPMSSQATETAPMVLSDYPQAYLMGGREDPYSADPNYQPPTWGVGRYELPVREDPYASMGVAARGGR